MQAWMLIRALPARIVIAKSAKARSDGGQTFFERAVLAILRNVTAKIQLRTPRTFSRPRGAWVDGKNRGEDCRKNSRSENVAHHV
jgi:hypothetical protein